MARLIGACVADAELRDIFEASLGGSPTGEVGMRVYGNAGEAKGIARMLRSCGIGAEFSALGKRAILAIEWPA